MKDIEMVGETLTCAIFMLFAFVVTGEDSRKTYIKLYIKLIAKLNLYL